MMKRTLSIVTVVAGVFALSCGTTAQTKEISLENQNDSLSYAMGVDIMESLRSQGITEVNPEIFAAGLRESGSETMMIPAQECRMYIQTAMKAMAEEKSAAAKADGLAFLEENKSKEGVVTTASGLQYKVIEEGTGKSPIATDQVKVHYHGTLIDGTVFDSSVDRGEPASFPLNRVIPGWTEGLQLMKEGGKTTFYIPSNLAYGSQDKGTIKPYSTLIFEVELIEVLGE